MFIIIFFAEEIRKRSLNSIKGVEFVEKGRGFEKELIPLKLRLITFCPFLTKISTFLVKICRFLVKKLKFLVKICRFLVKKVKFLVKNTKFLVKICQFLVKKVKFLIKNGQKAGKIVKVERGNNKVEKTILYI